MTQAALKAAWNHRFAIAQSRSMGLGELGTEAKSIMVIPIQRLAGKTTQASHHLGSGEPELWLFKSNISHLKEMNR